MSHLADHHPTPSPLNRPAPCILNPEITASDRGRDQVCIYAAGQGRNEAPLEDDAWDTWALNLVAPLDSKGRLRADVWFDLHQRTAQTEDDLRWIAKCPVPIAVPGDLVDASENAVRFPLEIILDAFPGAPFASTFNYQIALAILAGYQRIGLFGVELCWGDKRERTVEWASVNWWIGYAEAKGIEIVRPLHSRLGKHPRLYGFDYEREKENTERYIEMIEEMDSGRGFRGAIDGV